MPQLSMEETRAPTGRGFLLRLMRFMRIQRGEEAAVLWTAALFAASQASQGLGANTADTLFFLRFGVEFLPTMILLSGPVVMITILAHAAGLGRIGSQRWLPVAFLGSSGLLTLERVGIGLDLPGIYPFVWLVGQAVIMLSFTAMWTVAGEVCTTRQAKRLFPVFASAGIAGGVIGNSATGPLAGALGTENLLLVQAGLLVTASALAVTIARRAFQSRPTPLSGSVLADFKSGLTATLGNPLLRLVAWVGVALGALLFLVVFPFSEIVTASFETEAEVAGFLGFFSAAATATTFVVSLFATNRMFARLGVVAALMVVPVVYVGGFALWLVSFNLLAATLVRGIQFTAVNAIGGTAWSSLFNVLPARRRGRVMAFMAAGPMQLGTMISGGLLLVGVALPQQARTSLGLALALIAVVLVWRMRSAYGHALVDAVKGGLVDLFTAPTTGIQKPALDADTLQAMSACLGDSRPEARAVAVAALGSLDDRQADELILEALRDDAVRVRAAALEVLASPDGEWRKHTHTLLSDPAPEIRRRTLELMWENRSLPDEGVTLALDDPAPEVRAMAATIIGGTSARGTVNALLHSAETGSIVAALDAVNRRPDVTDEDLGRFLDHPDRAVRGAVARALSTRPGTADLVGPLLDDPSIFVRRSAADALTTTGEGVSVLLQVLKEGSVRACDAAVRSLMESGRGGPDLAAWASQEIALAAYLRWNGLALQQQPALSPTAEYLLRLLETREERLERWAVMALTTPDTEDEMSTVMRGIWSKDPETQSQAMEALDSLGDRAVVRDLLAILEQDTSGVNRDLRTSLRELSSDHDYWIRALAYRCLREELTADVVRLVEAGEEDPSPLVRIAVRGLELPLMKLTETLDLMQRVLALQRVPLFAGIDPEDLERIASATTERHYEADEVIFEEGDEGDEMHTIIRGEVIASHRVGEQTVPIRTLGAGDHVGELAFLRGKPRSSDVTAGSDGVHTLVLRSPELQAILEERPEVAMAMLGTLADRLAAT